MKTSGRYGPARFFRIPNGEHTGRAWVVGARDRDGIDQIVKVYDNSDRTFADTEWKNLILLGASRRSVDTPAALWSERRSSVVNASEVLRGETLADKYPPNDQPEKCARVICELIVKFAQTIIPSSHLADLRFSELQRIHFWTAPDAAIPEVSFEGHAQEFLRDCERSRGVLGARADRLSTWWVSQLALLPDELQKLKMPVHNDLNSYNVLVDSSHQGVIDVGLMIMSTPFVEYGGVISHCGPTVKPLVTSAAKTLVTDLGIEVDDQSIENAVALFSVKRCLRRVAFLAEVPEIERNEQLYAEIRARTNLLGSLENSIPKTNTQQSID